MGQPHPAAGSPMYLRSGSHFFSFTSIIQKTAFSLRASLVEPFSHKAFERALPKIAKRRKLKVLKESCHTGPISILVMISFLLCNFVSHFGKQSSRICGLIIRRPDPINNMMHNILSTHMWVSVYQQFWNNYSMLIEIHLCIIYIR
jgi:hypothetical protein